MRKKENTLLSIIEKKLTNYSKKDKMLFPRMWSNTQSRHANGYKIWADLKSKESTPTFCSKFKVFL